MRRRREGSASSCGLIVAAPVIMVLVLIVMNAMSGWNLSAIWLLSPLWLCWGFVIVSMISAFVKNRL